MPGAGRLGDEAHCPEDAHGCPKCPHDVRGGATTGSPNVYVNNRKALRVGDKGVHAACCGPNTWVASEGAPGVYVNNKHPHRIGDEVSHCGGTGALAEGSGDVLIGNHVLGDSVGDHWVAVEVFDPFGRRMEGVRFEVTGAASFSGKSIAAAFKKTKVPSGKFELHLPDHPDARPYKKK